MNPNSYSANKRQIDADKLTPRLSWERSDCERRLLFPAGKFTNAGMLSSILLGVILAVAFYGALHFLPTTGATATIYALFYERGSIPYFETFFAGWGAAMLLIKWRKYVFQRRALKLEFIPSSPDFFVSPDTAQTILDALEQAVDDPRRFVLPSRIKLVLSNLRNLGSVTAVDEMFARQFDEAADENDSGYDLLRGVIWAIPVLGFIGTVVGLSVAIGSFGGVLSQAGGVEELKTGLQQITGGLSVAFDTTLTGLVFALALQLLMTVEKQKETEFLDDCRQFCTQRIIARCRAFSAEA